MTVSLFQIVKPAETAPSSKGRTDKPLIRRKSDLPHNPSTARALEMHKHQPPITPADTAPRLPKWYGTEPNPALVLFHGGRRLCLQLWPRHLRRIIVRTAFALTNSFFFPSSLSLLFHFLSWAIRYCGEIFISSRPVWTILVRLQPDVRFLFVCWLIGVYLCLFRYFWCLLDGLLFFFFLLFVFSVRHSRL